MDAQLITQIVLAILVPAVFAWVAFSWRTHSDLQAYKLHVAETYAQKPQIDVIAMKMDEIRDAVTRLAEAVAHMQGRLESS